MSNNLWRFCEGQVIEGKYHLRELLGVGSFGGVFLTDEVVADRLMRQVAVKLMEPDTENLDRQMQELIAAANLDHPALLRCIAPGQCILNRVDFLYLIIELAQGTLEERMADGPMPEPEVRAIGQTLASALEYLHGQSLPLVHRDIKPANVMRVAGRWKLGDFGLLRAVERDGSRRTGALVGTPAYAPPESYDGLISPAWDIWSLGVLLQEMLTGTLPFCADTPHQMMIAIASRAPEIPAGLSPTMEQTIRGCLVKDPVLRWTATQVLAALSGTSPSAPIAALPDAFVARMVSSSPASEEVQTITVSADGRAQCRTVGEALKTARPNARILVRPGLYEEALVIQSPVEIIGDGDVEKIVIETKGTECLILQTDHAVIRGLTLISRMGLAGRKHAAVDIQRGQCLLEACHIVCGSLCCVSIHGAGADPTLQRCTLREGKTGGVLVSDHATGTLDACEIKENAGPGVAVTAGGDLTLRRCRIHGGKQAGVQIGDGGSALLEECEIYDNLGAGIEVSDNAQPTFRRCKIYDGKQAGVVFRKNGRGLLDDCDVYSNVLTGITLTQGANPVIRGCRIYEGQSNGIWVTENGQGTLEECAIFRNAFAGLKISHGGAPLVQKCAIYEGKRTGVTVQDKGRGTLMHCDISANQQTGILVEASAHLVIRHCILHDGQEAGIRFLGSGTVEECDIFGHAKAGLEIAQGADPTVRDCTIHQGHYPGILIHDGGLGAFEQCDIFENAMAGVAVGEGSHPLMRRCQIHHSKQVGMVFWGGSAGIVDDCDISDNVLEGVRLRQGGNPVIRDCRIQRNGNYGLVVTEQGAGTLQQCDLSDNRHGPWSIEPGCITRCIDTTPAFPM